MLIRDFNAEIEHIPIKLRIPSTDHHPSYTEGVVDTTLL